MKKHDRALLVILDGWGHGPDPDVSAIAQAETPFIDSLYDSALNSELITHGSLVGLPEGQMGNSEVGHMNIGAGRIVYQELARINQAIEHKELHSNSTLVSAFQKAHRLNKNIHFFGLLSDGGVHSHINHLKALIEIAEDQKVENIYIHCFLDGRDTDPNGGIEYLQDLQKFLKGRSAQISSIVGRYYAMDRDKRWKRIKLAYDLLVHGKGKHSEDLNQALNKSYEDGVTDEFVLPIIKIDADRRPIGTISTGDLVVCYNFRTDRCRQITQVLTQESMPQFDMETLDVDYITMTNYDNSFKGIEVLFEKENLENTLGEILEHNGKSQVRIAETEKYPHVTYFFSGGREEEFKGEKRIMVPSPKVATYDLKPEMSALEVTAEIIAEIQANQPDFICLNYANTDMVGHTGVFEAAVKAAEIVDSCAKDLIAVAEDAGYGIIIIADHGNSDIMINPDGSPHTAHTLSPVPCFILSEDLVGYRITDGKLADIAPTILKLMGIDCPEIMTGSSLLVKEEEEILKD